MTLTTVLPGPRQTLPGPLRHDTWPADTIAAPGDIVIGGVSLLQEACRSGMPLVHGDAVRAVAVGRVFARVDAFDDLVIPFVRA